MSRDKRETERLPVLEDMAGEIQVFQPMVILEFSRLGVMIDTGVPL